MDVKFMIQFDEHDQTWVQEIVDSLNDIVDITGHSYNWGDPESDYRGVQWVVFLWHNPTEAVMSMLHDVHNDWFYLTQIQGVK